MSGGGCGSGGMGMRNIREFNEALRVKWLSRFPKEKTELCCEGVGSKFEYDPSRWE